MGFEDNTYLGSALLSHANRVESERGQDGEILFTTVDIAVRTNAQFAVGDAS